MAAEGTAARQNERRGVGRALLLTLASTILPGLAHLWAGRRVAGAILLVVSLGAFIGLGLAAGDLALIQRLVVQPRWLIAFGAVAIVVALLWAGVVLRSYLLVRPHRMGPLARFASAAFVATLCLVVAAPLGAAAGYSYVQYDLVTSLFRDGKGGGAAPAEDPWEGRQRINILLLGGDAARNRTGVRTDSMTVASVNVKTGNTVIFSLPRNMENVPLPRGKLRDTYPFGFDGLLNEVYEYVAEHPDMQPLGAADPAAQVLKETIGGILGLEIDYYALVDMRGFAQLVDAMGGVMMNVERPIPYGLEGGVIEAGRRRLTGQETLWYGRSRVGSDDYTRMGRQKCVLGAIARQADPVKLLTRFQQLASATKRAVSTDIPQDVLPALMDLSTKVRGADIDSMPFVPKEGIWPGNPNWRRIRALTAEAIADSDRPKSGRGKKKKAKSLDETCPQ
ncbi:MAG: LytR family transcriptional regulator [Streptosporangiales bacterium]|nr:LytR family transcriptional regulator [Streptosporangiales bacterium]